MISLGGGFARGSVDWNMEEEPVGLFVHPSATITYLCDDPVRHTLPDYNGDRCTLVRGLTVIVNEYGEFVPVKYLPIR